MNKLRKRISGKRTIRAGKGFTLLISNEDMDDMIKIVESLEKLALLIDGDSDTVKPKIKNKKVDFFLL